MNQDWPADGQRTENCYLFTAEHARGDAPQTNVVKEGPRQFCCEYNIWGKCFHPSCKFRHECATVAGVHTSASCPWGGTGKRGSPWQRAITFQWKGHHGRAFCATVFEMLASGLRHSSVMLCKDHVGVEAVDQLQCMYGKGTEVWMAGPFV